MQEKDWETFFASLRDVIQTTPGITWHNKAEELEKQANERGEDGFLEELQGWLNYIFEGG